MLSLSSVRFNHSYTPMTGFYLQIRSLQLKRRH